MSRPSGSGFALWCGLTLLLSSMLVTLAQPLLAREALAWFGERLLTPARFNRTRSKGYYLRSTRGICWFRDTASEHIEQMHRIVAILEAYRHPVTIIRESRVGYLVYEDDFQVVAEPFADTRTGASR